MVQLNARIWFREARDKFLFFFSAKIAEIMKIQALIESKTCPSKGRTLWQCYPTSRVLHHFVSVPPLTSGSLAGIYSQQ